MAARFLAQPAAELRFSARRIWTARAVALRASAPRSWTARAVALRASAPRSWAARAAALRVSAWRARAAAASLARSRFRGGASGPVRWELSLRAAAPPGFRVSRAAGRRSMSPPARRARCALPRWPPAGARPVRRRARTPRSRAGGLVRLRGARSTWPRRERARRQGARDQRYLKRDRPARPTSWTQCWRAAWPQARWDRSLWATFSPVRGGVPRLRAGATSVTGQVSLTGHAHTAATMSLPRERIPCSASLRCVAVRGRAPTLPGGILHGTPEGEKTFRQELAVDRAFCGCKAGAVGRSPGRAPAAARGAAVGTQERASRVEVKAGDGSRGEARGRGERCTAPGRAARDGGRPLHRASRHRGFAPAPGAGHPRGPGVPSPPDGWTGAPERGGMAAKEARCSRGGRRSALARLPPEVIGGEPGSRHQPTTARHVPASRSRRGGPTDLRAMIVNGDATVCCGVKCKQHEKEREARDRSGWPRRRGSAPGPTGELPRSRSQQLEPGAKPSRARLAPPCR